MTSAAAARQPDVDLATVDALARFVLVARRLGLTVSVERPSQELVELLDLVGLRGQVLGEPERGEQPGVELQEAVVADDLLG